MMHRARPRLSTLFAALFRDEPPSVGSSHSLRVDVSIAQRIEEARRALVRRRRRSAPRADRRSVAVARCVRGRLALHRVALEDVSVSAEPRYAAPFVLREGWALGIAGPVALWGTLNHWLPFHAARVIARRSIESASDPAMRTIVAGAALGARVLRSRRARRGAGCWLDRRRSSTLSSLPLAADVNFVLRERLRRAVRRARTYLLFRRRPRLHAQLRATCNVSAHEALEIEAAAAREQRQRSSLTSERVSSASLGAAEPDRRDPSATPRVEFPCVDP